MRALIVLLLCFSTPVVFAGVYHCVDEKGDSTFQDRPCPVFQKATVLAYRSLKTPKELASQKTSATVSKRKTKRKKGPTPKQRAEALAKQKRREARCAQTKEKLKTIRLKLLAGCKVSRANRLKEQRTHFERMKKRYCCND